MYGRVALYQSLAIGQCITGSKQPLYCDRDATLKARNISGTLHHSSFRCFKGANSVAGMPLIYTSFRTELLIQTL